MHLHNMHPIFKRRQPFFNNKSNTYFVSKNVLSFDIAYQIFKINEHQQDLHMLELWPLHIFYIGVFQSWQLLYTMDELQRPQFPTSRLPRLRHSFLYSMLKVLLIYLVSFLIQSCFLFCCTNVLCTHL